MLLRLKNKEYNLSTSLRVVYALRDITHAKSLKEAIDSISSLDVDGQLELLYASYKAGEGRNGDALSKDAFMDDVLDTLGIFALTDAINKLTEGLLYSGLSPEEVSAKKEQMEVATAAMIGEASSVEDTN